MAGLDMVTSTLIKETDSKNAYWMSPITLASLDVPAKAYLLPGFDEYMLGYKDRTAALDRRHAQKIAPENNGRFMSTMIFDGRSSGYLETRTQPEGGCPHYGAVYCPEKSRTAGVRSRGRAVW
jgi:hypothetical protein